MIEIPRESMLVRYVGKCYPGAAGVVGIKEGANCQQFAYELLRHFGRQVPNMRSSELWADETYTERVNELEPLDLLFFTKDGDPWAAHIAVYLGESQVIHLSQEVGYPQVLGMDEFSRIDRYKILLGAKRVRYETEELVTPI